MNKANGGDGIPIELFQILNDAMKVLHSICQQIWKTQQWSQDWKRSVFIQIPKKDNAKECSAAANLLQSCPTLRDGRDSRDGSPPGSSVHGIFQARVLDWGAIAFSQRMFKLLQIALISHASQVIFKILQARLQEYMNHELSHVQGGFRKRRGTRVQIANIWWIMEKAWEFQKIHLICFIDYTTGFDCVDHKKLWKILKEMHTTLSVSWDNCMQVKKWQLELDMEQ